MPLTTHTLTLTTKVPGTDLPLDGTWTLSVAAEPPVLLDKQNHIAFAGAHTAVTVAGEATLTVPASTQTDLEPAGAYYQLSFRSRANGYKLGPFTFQVTENMTLDDIAAVTNVPITPTQLERAETAAETAEAAATDAETAAAAAAAVGTTSDTVIAGRIADTTSATRAQLSAAYAPAKGLHYLNVYTEFFNSQDSADNPAIWTNPSHVNDTGLAQWAAHIAGELDAINTLTAPKVVWFGDSWVSQNPTILATATTNAIPGATVVNAGVSGNTSTAMLARFAADVPADADYVIFNEPGVNDIYQSFTPAQIVANLEALVVAIRGIGAIPIFTGIPPLSEHKPRAAVRNLELSTLIGDGSRFPAPTASAVPRVVTPNNSSIGVGGMNKVTTGISNTVLGVEAGRDLTTGNSNTAVGDKALRVATSGGFNAAFGQGSLTAATGSENTGVGAYTLLGLTTGTGNTAIGKSAAYAPGGTAANAITSGSYNVCIGMESGTRTTQSYTTSIGYRAVADGYRSMALGAFASCAVPANGAVAIGQDSSGTGAAATAQNDFILGTGNHNVKVPGRLAVATRTPSGSADTQGQTGDVTWDADYFYVKTAAGWKRAALTTW